MVGRQIAGRGIRSPAELASHYANAALAEQFDAYVWLDETAAVTPLPPPAAARGRVPDTYPFGV